MSLLIMGNVRYIRIVDFNSNLKYLEMLFISYMSFLIMGNVRYIRIVDFNSNLRDSEILFIYLTCSS